MKTTNKIPAILVILLTLGFYACTDDEYPINIPFSNYDGYSLSSSYAFETLENGVPVIINSEQELRCYFDSTESYIMPNFAKQSLIAIYGGSTTKSIRRVEKRLEQTGDKNYKLYLDLYVWSYPTSPNYKETLLVNKLPSNAIITAIVTEHDSDGADVISDTVYL